MSIEKEQFEKVMAELRRACLPAGGADAVQAYVDSLAGGLARVEASAATLATAGRGAWARADAVQALLATAVGLLRFAYDHAEQHRPGSLPNEQRVRAFLAEAEQQETPAPLTCEAQRAICGNCGGSGDVHRPDGEWLGTCPCPAGQQVRLAEIGRESLLPESQRIKPVEQLRVPRPLEAQDAQAGGGLDAIAEAIFNADKDNWFSVGPYPQLHANDRARLRAMARAALATQPAATDGVVYVEVSGLTGTGKSAVAGEIEVAMLALGLEVQWTEGDSEMRLNHADFAGELELYKPRVEIRERNIARPAVRGAEHE
jgi:hypothetical protein